MTTAQTTQKSAGDDHVTAPVIRLFRPGTFTSAEGREVSFTAADLAAVASGYDKASDPAPLVVGHPSSDDPAYGWVDSLSFADGFLTALPERVAPAFAEAVRQGSYAKVSAQFYPPEDPNNPKPGAWYLKHIGFLGAHPAAVKGLGIVSMGEEGGDKALVSIALEVPEKGATGSSETGSVRPFSFHEQQILQPQKEVDMTGTPKDKTKGDADEGVAEAAKLEAAKQVSFAERETALKAREDAIAAKETAATKAAKDAQHADNVSFAEGQIKALTLAPAAKDIVVGLLDGLDATAKVSFGEGTGEITANAAFRKLFDGAVPLVSFGEMAKGDGKKPDEDPAEMGIRAAAYVEEQRKKGINITPAAAVRQLMKKGN